MKLADAHIHLFAAGYPGKYGPLFTGGGESRIYRSICQAHQISRALVIGFEGEKWARGNNRYIAQMARDSEVLTPIAYAAPSTPPSISRLWEQGFRGISLYLNDESDVKKILDWPEAVFVDLNQRRAIISLNIPLSLAAAVRPFYESLSGSQILISHFGMPGQIPGNFTAREARTLLEPLIRQAELPHVGVKLSGLYACNKFPHKGFAPVIKALEAAFTGKRLYWGSDFAPALDEVTFAQTISAVADLVEGSSAQDIFHRNLDRLIRRVRDIA